MTTPTIPFADIEREVRRIAAENPDFVCKRPIGSVCKYFIAGEPSCIFGHTFRALGADHLAIELVDVDGLFDDIDCTDLQAKWARRVQIWQDRGASWGAAVQNADREAPLAEAAAK